MLWRCLRCQCLLGLAIRHNIVSVFFGTSYFSSFCGAIEWKIFFLPRCQFKCKRHFRRRYLYSQRRKFSFACSERGLGRNADQDTRKFVFITCVEMCDSDEHARMKIPICCDLKKKIQFSRKINKGFFCSIEKNGPTATSHTRTSLPVFNVVKRDENVTSCLTSVLCLSSAPLFFPLPLHEKFKVFLLEKLRFVRKPCFSPYDPFL